MATVQSRNDNSTAGALLVILGILVAIVIGFFIFNQGYFGDSDLDTMAPAAGDTVDRTTNNYYTVPADNDAGAMNRDDINADADIEASGSISASGNISDEDLDN